MVVSPQDGNGPSSTQKGDFLKLFYTLAESDRNVRTQAAEQLLSYLKSSAKQETEVQYTLKRLVRGLASSRDAARQGFSTALSGLLTVFPMQLPLQSTHKLVREAMEVHSSMKPMEQREHMFGLLFGLLALHRSGRLHTDLPLLISVIKELLSMALFKRWFRETCYEAALTLLDNVPKRHFVVNLAVPIHTALQLHSNKSNENDEPETWNADQVLLAVGVQHYLHVTGLVHDDEQMKLLPVKFRARHALERHHVHKLAHSLKGSLGCYPRVHSAWLRVFGHVLNATDDASVAVDAAFFQEAWTVLVENSLVGGNGGENSTPTSHECQGLALKLCELLVPQLSAPLVCAILTPHFVKCLYNNSIAKRNYLHGAARHCLKSFAKYAPGEFFHFICQHFTSPLSTLVTLTRSESDEEDEKPAKAQTQSMEGFAALLDLEDKNEREEAMRRRTDRARVWAIETMVNALTELLVSTRDADDATKTLQDNVLCFLVFHSFFSVSSETVIRNENNTKATNTKTVNVDVVAQEAAAATPDISEIVANYAKTRLFSLISFGLAGANGACASASVLSQIFALAQDMQRHTGVVMLRKPLDEKVSSQFCAVIRCVDTLRGEESRRNKEDKNKIKAVTHRPRSETFLLLFMSTGLQLLDAEQRQEAAVVAADLEKCYAQLVACEDAASSLNRNSKKKEKTGDAAIEPIVVLTDLLLSLLSQDSSALREIVTLAFRSLLPLLTRECLILMTNVLQPTSEGFEEDDNDDEFAPVTQQDDDNNDQEIVRVSSSNALTNALRNDKKLSALHHEDLALAAIVGQVKGRSQQKKDRKRARLQTMHFHLRVVDLLHVFVTERSGLTSSARATHQTLVISLIVPLVRVLARVETADATQLVLRDRLQAVLLHKVLGGKDKVPSSVQAQTEALAALRQLVDLVRTTLMDKNHSGKVASAAIVYLVRVLCTGEAGDEVQGLLRAAVLDAFTTKHSRIPRALFEDLVAKFPVIGAQVLLKPLAAVAAATNKEKATEAVVRPAVNEFSKCEMFRLLTLLLRGLAAGPPRGKVPQSLHCAMQGVEQLFKTALVRQLAPESVHQLKAKRLKVVLMFALQLVKWWRNSEDPRATETDVHDVVAAVQAIDFKSPAIKTLMKNVLGAAGSTYVAHHSVKADTKVDNEDELEKSKKTRSPKDKQRKKRKRSIAE